VSPKTGMGQPPVGSLRIGFQDYLPCHRYEYVSVECIANRIALRKKCGMKKFLRSPVVNGLWLFFTYAWTSIPALAEIPAGYYANASGKTGSALKSALHSIIAGHTKKTYTEAWELIKETDEDPANANNVILLYTGRSQEKEYRDHGYSWDYTQYDGGDGEYNESWNREHVWAKSHGFPSESDTAYSDLHHLRPADRTVNSSRNNKDFDNGGTLHPETQDCYTDDDSWEPRDEVKGDIARMVFYMVVRYDPGIHSDDSEYDLELVDSTGMDLGLPPGRPVLGKLSTLLAWHEADPVDSFEQNRNEVIYGYQGNRNPFIDHPEYAAQIWNDALQAPTNLTASNVTTNSLTLSWADNASDETGFYVYRNDSRISTLDANATNVAVTGLTGSTTYNFKVSAYKITTESDKASLDVTTGGSGNLIITGIFDGPRTGGLPKGVELYAINDIADLSAYGIGSSFNGAASSGEDFTLSGSASAGQFLTVSYESTEFNNWFSSPPTFTSSAANINGDDVIELFYQSTAIDVYGVLGVDGTGEAWEYMDGWAYSKNDREVSTTFNSADWTFSGINALDGESTNSSASSPVPLGTFTYSDGSLPVVLSTWQANSSDGCVKLTWITESEIENQGFILERRSDAKGWTEIASFDKNVELVGQGSTTSRTVYTYFDIAVEAGHSYEYCLSDMDYRGNLTRHAIRQVSVREEEEDTRPSKVTLYPVYPNPFNPQVSIAFSLLEPIADLSLEIFDLHGMRVWFQDLGGYSQGVHHLDWDGKDTEGKPLPSGTYLIRLSGVQTMHLQRVTLIR